MQCIQKAIVASKSESIKKKDSLVPNDDKAAEYEALLGTFNVVVCISMWMSVAVAVSVCVGVCVSVCGWVCLCKCVCVSVRVWVCEWEWAK